MAHSLPAELMRQVFLCLKVDHCSNPSSTLPQTLGVCKLWRQIGWEVLYSDISVTEFKLAKLAESSPSARMLTRTLSINISCNDLKYANPCHEALNVASIDLRLNEDAWTAIHTIPRIVRDMVQLESFSLVIPTYPPQNKTRCRAVHSAIPYILKALPNSVKHLEIDTIDACFQYCPPLQPHFCPLLRERMPSLSNLRLRLPRLCGQLFQRCYFEHFHDPEDASRRGIMECTVLINTVNPDVEGTDFREYLTLGRSEGLANDCLVVLVQTAQSAIYNGRCQEPPRLSFFTRRRGASEGPVFSAFNELAVMPTVKTLRYPYREIPDQDGAFLRYRELDGSQGEAWGPWNALTDMFEGQVWVETMEGYRVPSVYLKQNLRFKQSVAKSTLLLKRRRTGAAAKGTLFSKEKAEGRLLLRVQETSRFQPHIVIRESTRKELDQATNADMPNPGPDEGDNEDLKDLVTLAPEDEA
ncbi:hypothetical protein AYO21_03323 [Fonsecaea monophora]|uniref:F-box domain-containing protein n=1 Tax=Fonsecaea monophora TaxID=254056 RepID=A0A177FDZ2_9EURO|nr:hypothetical protein AYO21_03323 [Fonsecaea monophora]OAG42447.1 hypothetical protein AYO21_03323 [Fonsecaea monophora]